MWVVLRRRVPIAALCLAVALARRARDGAGVAGRRGARGAGPVGARPGDAAGGGASSCASLGPARGAALAVAALSDPDDEVRLAAADTAIHLRAAGATDAVAGWLERAGRPRAPQGVRGGARAAEPRAVAPLARTLGDPDAEVRAEAAEALGRQTSPEAVAPLLGRLDDPTPAVRIQIIAALARLGDARAVVPLVGKVEDSSPDVRQAVVRALGDLGDARASAALVLALRDQNADVRRDALTALGRMRAADTVDAIAPFVGDSSPALRLAALDGARTDRDARRACACSSRPSARTTTTPEPCSRLRRATPSSPRAAAAIPSLRAAAGRIAVAAGRDERGVGPRRAARPRRGARDRPGHAPGRPAHRGGAARARGRRNGRGRARRARVRRRSKPDRSRRGARCGARAPRSEPPRRPRGRAPRRGAARRAAHGGRARAHRDAARPHRGPTRRAAARRADARPGPRRCGSRPSTRSERSGRRPPPAAASKRRRRDRRVARSARRRPTPPSACTPRPPSPTPARDRARDALMARLDGGDEIDRAAVLTALGGVLARVADARRRSRSSAQALALSAGPERDAIIEALGRAPLPAATSVLASVARSEEAADRRAAATMSAARPGDASLARALLADPDASVRAQAAWSLGCARRRVGHRAPRRDRPGRRHRRGDERDGGHRPHRRPRETRRPRVNALRTRLRPPGVRPRERVRRARARGSAAATALPSAARSRTTRRRRHAPRPRWPSRGRRAPRPPSALERCARTDSSSAVAARCRAVAAGVALPGRTHAGAGVRRARRLRCAEAQRVVRDALRRRHAPGRHDRSPRRGLRAAGPRGRRRPAPT